MIHLLRRLKNSIRGLLPTGKRKSDSLSEQDLFPRGTILGKLPWSNRHLQIQDRQYLIQVLQAEIASTLSSDSAPPSDTAEATSPSTDQG